MDYIYSEIAILQQFKNTIGINNIVRLYEIIEDDSYISIIMEKADMDLEQFWLKYNRRIPERIVIEVILTQILEGMKLLH
jgi:serine/threonine protein kinase